MRTNAFRGVGCLLLGLLASCGGAVIETGARTSSDFGSSGGDTRAESLVINDESVFPEFSLGVKYYVTHCPDDEMSFKADGSFRESQSFTYVDGYVKATMKPGDSIEIAGNEVKCLPDDMPLPQATDGFDMGGAVLLSTTLDTSSDAVFEGLNPYLMLLDQNGAPVWWRSGVSAEAHAEFIEDESGVALMSYIENGDSKAVFSHLPGSGYVVERVLERGGVKTLQEIKRYAPTGVPLDFHDAVLTKDGLVGMYYKIDTEPRDTGLTKTPDILNIGFGSKDVCLAKSYKRARLAVGALVFVNKAGVKVVEISHDGLPSITGALWHTPTGEVEDCVIDIDHLNAVDIHEDFYLVTMRHRDTVAAVDKEGEVLWSVGGQDGTVGLQILGDPLGGPVKPHDGRLVGDVLTMFDNHSGKSEARVVSYKIDLKKGTATLIYEGRAVCKDTGCSAFAMGSARKNGEVYVAAMGTSSEISLSVLDSKSGRQRGSLWFDGYWSYRAVFQSDSVLDLARTLTSG